jgi:hypothetical protein
MKNGRIASDISASSQLSRNIAMIVLTEIARLLVMELAVSVTTAWTPPTSLASRLWISPVRVSLKNRIERAPQVLHHALADDVVEVALAHPDEAGHDRDDDHEPDEQVQVVVVAPHDDLVDERLEQERVDEAEQARDEDGHEDHEDLEPVGPEEVEDPPDRLPATLLRDRREVARHPATEEAAVAAAPTAATSAAAPATTAASDPAGHGAGRPARKAHQAVAVAASVMPWASSQRSASMAALQPSAAAVTAWR